MEWRENGCDFTRGVQKVRRLTQLVTRYANHILSLFNIVSCNWNALGGAFLQISDSVIEELLFLVLQPAIYLPCNTNTNGEYSGWRSSSKPAFWTAASAWAGVWSGALSWLQVTSICFLNWKNSWKDTKFLMTRTLSAWQMAGYGRPRTTILLQRNQRFGETLDQVRCSCRWLCWKLTKYDAGTRKM